MRWVEYSLGELANIARGGSPRPIKEFLTEELDGVNWIKISDATASGKFIEHTKQKIRKEGVPRSRMVYPGDFLLSNSMSFGRPYIMKTTGAIHDGWLVFQDIVDFVSSDFLYHLLGSKLVGDQFEEKASGSTVRNLNIDRVKSVHVPIPPLEEQERIVEVLDEAFAAIDKAKANIERNLTNARELFQSRLNDIFSNPSEDWEVKPLKEVVTEKITKGATPTTYGFKFVESGIPFLRSECVSSNGFNTKGIRFIQNEAHEHMKRSIVKCGDLLISITGNVGRAVILPEDVSECNINQHIARVRIDANFVRPEFVKFHVMSKKVQDYFQDVQNGTAYPLLSLKQIKETEIGVPPPANQSRVVAELNSLHQMKENLETRYQSELDNLEELRQSILEQAFEGKLTAERIEA